jgi:hypothetical protein
VLQVCRKNDPFSPQARWGDDGARQVQIELPIAARLGKLLDATSWTRLRKERIDDHAHTV